jgi:hypothetical protein
MSPRAPWIDAAIAAGAILFALLAIGPLFGG